MSRRSIEFEESLILALALLEAVPDPELHRRALRTLGSHRPEAEDVRRLLAEAIVAHLPIADRPVWVSNEQSQQMARPPDGFRRALEEIFGLDDSLGLDDDPDELSDEFMLKTLERLEQRDPGCLRRTTELLAATPPAPPLRHAPHLEAEPHEALPNVQLHSVTESNLLSEADDRVARADIASQRLAPITPIGSRLRSRPCGWGYA